MEENTHRTYLLCQALLAEFGVSLPRGSKDLALRLRQACDDLPHILQRNFHTLIDEIVQLSVVSSLNQLRGSTQLFAEIFRQLRVAFDRALR